MIKIYYIMDNFLDYVDFFLDLYEKKYKGENNE